MYVCMTLSTEAFSEGLLFDAFLTELPLAAANMAGKYQRVQSNLGTTQARGQAELDKTQGEMEHKDSKLQCECVSVVHHVDDASD